MAIGDVSVRVVPDATDFWRSFRARTQGQAQAEGRRAGEEFRRGLEGANSRPIQVRAELDAARLRAQLDELTRSQTVRVRAEVNTTRARAELQSLERQGQQSGGGLIKALLPLAPALFPLAGAALAAGSGLAIMGSAGVLAVTGLNRELHSTSETGGRAAAAVGVIKNELHSLQATAAKAALPGLEASVLTIRRELPGLRQVIGEQASVAGQVIAHLTSGIVGGFTTFRPIISAVGSDVDALAAHFDKFANGPGGARFARTLASDYAEVKPVLESVVRAVVDIARAASGSGLGILHILGNIANLIDSFPTPVLTAIVDGFLAFRAVGLASTAISGVGRALDSVKTSAQTTAAIVRLSSLEATSAREAEAAAAAVASQTIAENNLRDAESARVTALQIIQAREGVRAVYSAEAQALLASADVEIAAYRAVAEQASAAATQQVAAARAAAGAASGARSAAAGRSVGGTLLKALGPIALVATALPLLSGLFGDNGESAQEAAAQVDGYTSALVNSKGAIDDNIRSQVATALQQKGVFAAAKQFGITQAQVTDAVLNGGTALDSVNKVLYANRTALDKSASGMEVVSRAHTATGKSATGLSQVIADQNAIFGKAQGAAADIAAANSAATASIRAHAAALHTDVATYQAATDAAAKSTAQTRAQTVAFQLENDAASLLSQALKGLAGQNLDVAQAQTSFEQAIHSVRASMKENGEAIAGNSTKALANQQAIQGSVSAARQYADAVAKQTGSSRKASAAYRASRDELLSQLAAHHRLTPEVRKYINTLFDVKGVSDYLTKHPTKLDVNKQAADAKVAQLQQTLNNIRQGRIPALTLNSIEAQNQISRIQGMIDALHGKTVVISTITPDGSSINVGNGGRGFQLASGGPVHGPGTGTSDSIPAWLSNGEFVVNAKATAKHRHLLESINKGARGFAAGGAVGNAQQIASALRAAFGLSGNQIAGILGNLKVESGFNPRAYNARENAHGFAQWEGPRWTALQRFAANMGVSASSTRAQVAFLVQELRGSGLVSQIRRMSDPGRVAALVDARYERSSGSTRQARIDAARQIARSGVAGSAGSGVGGIVHSGKDWIFNGVRYATERAALNAQTRAEQKADKAPTTRIQNLIGRIGQSASPPFDINQRGFRAISAQIRRAQVALLSWHAPLEKTRKYEEQIIRLSTILQHQLQNLRIKVNGADLGAIKKALGGTASDLHEAFKTLNTDLRNIGSSSLNLSRARKQEGQILAANRRYTAARDYSASIKGTLAGGFDPTHFGSAADLIAGLRGQAGQNNSYASELKALRGKSKGDKTLTAFINQLAASGQTATLESLAGASKTDLVNVSKSLGVYNQSLTAGANAATVSKFGATDTQLHDVLTKLDKRLDAWIAAEVRFTAALAESHRRSPEHTARQIEHALAELQTVAHHGRN